MTIHDRPDWDHAIAELSAQRQQLQAQLERAHAAWDTSRAIDFKVALADVDRRLCLLRGQKEAAKPVELSRGAIFYGSNS
jgi:multidrug resistance efflux pump